jgi:hypothetical protein
MFKTTSSHPEANRKQSDDTKRSSVLPEKKGKSKIRFDEQIAKVLKETKVESKSKSKSLAKKAIVEKEETKDIKSDDSDETDSCDSSKGSSTVNDRKSRTKLGELSEAEKDERHRDQMKEWRSKNPDYNKTYRQKYYAEHREEILEKRRQKRVEEKKLLEEFKLYKAAQIQ